MRARVRFVDLMLIGDVFRGLELPRPVWDQVKDSPEVKAALDRKD